MSFGVAPGVLAKEVEHGCECPEVVVRSDMELDGFLGHASSMHDGDK